jgi:hypothetical protein
MVVLYPHVKVSTKVKAGHWGQRDVLEVGPSVRASQENGAPAAVGEVVRIGRVRSQRTRGRASVTTPTHELRRQAKRRSAEMQRAGFRFHCPP